MNVDMSPEAVGSRLVTMAQLWELSVALMGTSLLNDEPLSGSSRRMAIVTDCVRKVLIDDWDPLGVQGIPEATDEYDDYIAGIHQILLGSRSSTEIVDNLRRVEIELIEVCTSDLVRQGVAEKLLAIDIEV